MPGNIFAKTSLGTNRLLKEGATLVTSAQDVLEALNLKMVTAHSEARAVIPEDPTEAKLFALLSNDPTHIDYLVRESGLPVAQVSSTLALMELKGMRAADRRDAVCGGARSASGLHGRVNDSDE